MLTKLPEFSDKFSDHGPVLFFGEVPYAWGWVPMGTLTEPELAALDKYGKWETSEEGVKVLVNKRATIDQVNNELGVAKCVVLDKDSKFLFAVYNDATVRDERYDPRKIRRTLELSEDEYARHKE